MPWGHKYLKLACLPFHHGCVFRKTIPKNVFSVKPNFKLSSKSSHRQAHFPCNNRIFPSTSPHILFAIPSRLSYSLRLLP